MGISWIPNFKLVLRPLLRLPNVQMLELLQPSAHPASLKFLRGMTGLRSLRWAGAFPEDEMRVVGTLHNLRVLDLHYTQLNDAGLAHIASLTDVQELDVSSGPVTDAGLRHLSPLKRLRRLRLSDYRITDAGLALLPEFPELRELVAEMANASDASLLGKLPNLEVLSVPRYFGADAVPYINRMRNLRELDLSWAKIHGESAMQIDLPALERLEMTYTPGVVMHFAQRGTLQALHLSGALLGEGDLQALAKLPNLHELTASVEGVDLPFLASLPQLETLNLRGDMTSAELQALRKSRSLHSLDLSYAPKTDLTACDALPELFFCENRFVTLWERSLRNPRLK
ncbi:MAG: hypothetical protein R3B07_35400 [Polyangiaceae bacterium]